MTQLEIYRFEKEEDFEVRR